MNTGQRKRKKTLRSKVVNHHLRYEYNGLTHKQEERTLPVYFNEHYIIKLLQTRGKWVSKGFLFILVDFVLDRLITGNFVDLKIERKEGNL